MTPSNLVYLDGRIVPRAEAKVSVWDRGFQSGDAVYEGCASIAAMFFSCMSTCAGCFSALTRLASTCRLLEHVARAQANQHAVEPSERLLWRFDAEQGLA